MAKDKTETETKSTGLPKSRMQEKKEVQRKAAEERANTQKLLKAEYFKLKDSPAVEDLLKKLRGFIDYHTQIAKDGVAYESVPDGSGGTTLKTVRVTPEERLSHLDKSAGLGEILDYFNRQLL